MLFYNIINIIKKGIDYNDPNDHTKWLPLHYYENKELDKITN